MKIKDMNLFENYKPVMDSILNQMHDIINLASYKEFVLCDEFLKLISKKINAYEKLVIVEAQNPSKTVNIKNIDFFDSFIRLQFEYDICFEMVELYKYLYKEKQFVKNTEVK